MRSGKITNLEKEYSKKKIKYLVLAWISLLVSIAIVLTMFLLHANENIIFIVIFFLLICLFFILFFFKVKISFYDMQQRYQLLLKKSLGIIKTNCRFDNDWLVFLKESNYKQFVENSMFTIFFKIEKSITKKTFIRTNLIEIITIVKNVNLGFYDDQIESEYKKIWESHEKDHRLNKQIIIQFKKYDGFNDKIKNELDRIISYKEGDNYLININCGYIEGEESLYFLHSDKYYPNTYYKYAVDLIKKITRQRQS